jgi:hypothetical protein
MTAPDFQTQLRVQLRDAAKREERRGRIARPTGWLPRLSPVLAAAAIALVVLAVVLLGLALRGPNPSREAAPKAVDRFSVSGSLGPVMTAYGSVWAVDPVGRLLRLDPASHDVFASLDIPPRTNIGAGAGSLWVSDEDALIRIDPKTGGVVGRIPWRTPAGDPFEAFDLLFAGRYGWLIGIEGLLRIDLSRNAADRFVPLEAGGLIRGAALQGDTLWVAGRDQRLRRLDALTGARRGSLRVDWPPQANFAGDRDLALTWTRLDGRVARVDLATGRELWVREVGGSVGWWTAAGKDVWVHVSTGHGRDHLLRLDARTGRVLGKVQLPDLGVTTMTVVKPGEVWVGTPGGQIDVVKAAPR